MYNAGTQALTENDQTMSEPSHAVSTDIEPTIVTNSEYQQESVAKKTLLPDFRKWSSIVASAASVPATSENTEVIFSLAWALVLLERDQTEDVLFGIIRPRLSSSYPQLSSHTTLGEIMRPLCTGNTKGQTMDAVLKTLELQLEGQRHDSQSTLDDIPTPTSSCTATSDFSALLTVHSTLDDGIMSSMLEEMKNDSTEAISNPTLPLILDCSIGDNHEVVKYQLLFDESVMLPLEAEELLDRVRSTVSRICLHSANDMLFDLHDLSQTHGWEASLRNVSALPSIGVCAHNYIETVAEQQPEAIALKSWDGSLTYRELSDLASLLAARLLDVGLKPSRDTVSICSEKSMYVVVAILGVLKAGGSFLLLDPMLPSTQLRHDMEEVGSRITITSAFHSSKIDPLIANAIVVDSSLFNQLRARAEKWPPVKVPEMYPDDIAYVFHTAGFAGKPKSHRTTHRALSTAALNQIQALEIDGSTKVFQFSNFTNDACIVELVFSLFAGSCICIPSDEESSHDIEGAMDRYRANFAVLTPTVARFLDPQKLTILRTLCLKGEPVEQLDLETWTPKVRLMLAYGISECSSLALVQQDVTATTNPRNLSKAGLCGSRCWIVDPNDHEKLLNEGEIGEIVVEGPTVCAGYLNTASHSSPFIEAPSWLSSFRPTLQPAGRFIKTGDLAFWNEDGDIIFVGRQDRQVKLNGQKLDLNQVERDVRQALIALRPLQVVADIVPPGGLIKTRSLAVFVQFQNRPTEDLNAEVKLAKTTARPSSDWAALVKAHLITCLPTALLPKLYLPVDRVPLSRSGKIDRPRLCMLPSTLNSHQLGFSRGDKRHIIPPRTTQESELGQLWADVFGIKEDDIDINDTFFDLGGDSMCAMKLVQKARDIGTELAIADVLSKPILTDLAQSMTPLQASDTEIDTRASTELLQHISNKNQLCIDRIEDVYPATPYQMIAMSSSPKKPALSEVYRLGSVIDLDRFKEAWQLVIARTPVLRTRLVVQDGSPKQVVLRDSVNWTIFPSLQECLDVHRKRYINADECLSHCSLVLSEAGDHYFVRSLPPAAYDPWTYHQSWKLFRQAYNACEKLKSSPFKNLISYIDGQRVSAAAKAFWQASLAGFDSQHFPRSHIDGHEIHAKKYIEDTITLPWMPTDAKSDSNSNLTLATLITCAWAQTISHFTSANDVVFGFLSSGRTTTRAFPNAPALPDILDILGPTQTLIPVRVQCSPSHSPSLDPDSDSDSDSIVEMCERIQARSIEAIPHQYFPLHEMAALGQDCKKAYEFRNVLNIVHESLLSDVPEVEGIKRVMFAENPLLGLGYALYVECRLRGGSGKGSGNGEEIGILVAYDPQLLCLQEVFRVVERFKCVLQAVHRAVTAVERGEAVGAEDLGVVGEGERSRS